MNKTISFSSYYKFKANIITIPSSHNQMGVDIFPRYFLRPFELLEALEYTDNVRSTDDGFVKDPQSGLYLKNRKSIGTSISIEEVVAQYESIAMAPPYWFYDQTTYAQFIQLNMDSAYSGKLESRFNTTMSPRQLVEADEDEEIPVRHYYKETREWTTHTFLKNKIVLWPKNKGISISSINPPTTGEEDTSASGY